VLFVSGRTSFEIVQKPILQAFRRGCSLGASTMSIDLPRKSGLRSSASFTVTALISIHTQAESLSDSSSHAVEHSFLRQEVVDVMVQPAIRQPIERTVQAFAAAIMLTSWRLIRGSKSVWWLAMAPGPSDSVEAAEKTDVVGHRDQSLDPHACLVSSDPINMRCCRPVNSRWRFCHAEGSLTRTTSTAVTLYSGQFVAQSEFSVVTTLAPESGKWKVV
jgi:hypothetical protein